MRTLLHAATILGLGLAANPAIAEMPLPGEEPLVTGTEGFQALDVDGNGSVSVEEAQALESLSHVFADYDADSNGELSRTEYQMALNGQLEEEESE